MGISIEDFRAMEARLANTIRPRRPADAVADGQESKLHDEIVAWCNAQWPRWKILCARRDKKSTLPLRHAPMTRCLARSRSACCSNSKPESTQQDGGSTHFGEEWKCSDGKWHHPVNVGISRGNHISQTAGHRTNPENR